MLIRLFSADGGDYKKVLKRRCILFGALVVLGLATVAAAVVLGVTGVLSKEDSFIAGFYSGVGSGVAAGALLALVSTCKLMKNEQKMRSEQIKETDERGKMVTLRAMSATALILIAAVYVALMVTVVLNRTVFYTLMGVTAVFFTVFLSSRFYYDKKL